MTSPTDDSPESETLLPNGDHDKGWLQRIPREPEPSEPFPTSWEDATTGAIPLPSASASAGPTAKSPAAASTDTKTFHVGDVVSPADRDNMGTVIEVTDSACAVRFVNRESGNEAVKYFSFAELRMIKRCAKGKTPLRVLRYREMLELQPPPYIVEQLIRQRDLVVLYGAPASAKTFLAIDLVFSIAALPSWRRWAVRAGPILYIAAEGVFGLRRRAQAWQQRFGPNATDALHEQLYFVDSAVQISDDDDFERFLQLVQKLEREPALIVFDTFSRCAAGVDENSVRDVSAIIQRLDELRERTKCAVLLLHHTGKDDKLERGSTAIRGAADVMLRTIVKRKANATRGESMLIEISCEKVKDEEPFAPFVLELRVDEVTDKSTGEILRSCTLVDFGEAVGGKRRGGLPPRESEFVAGMYEAFRDRPASRTELKEAKCGGIPKSTFHAVIAALLEKNVLVAEQHKGHERLRLTDKGLGLIDTEKTDPLDSQARRPSEANSNRDTPAERPVQSRVRPPPKGGVDGSRLDGADGDGQTQESSPVQDRLENSDRTVGQVNGFGLENSVPNSELRSEKETDANNDNGPETPNEGMKS